jgi:hypothetical protein
MNRLLDQLSDFFAQRKGLLPLIGLILIILNFLLQLSPLSGWVVQTDLLLHLGLVIAIIGFLLAWAL